MEPVRYPQGRNMMGGCGCNTGKRGNSGYTPRQSQMRSLPDRTQNQKMPCEDRFKNNQETFPIGMAYVPWQTWGDLYPPEKGLCEGTIFMELNQVFCGKRGNRA